MSAAARSRFFGPAQTAAVGLVLIYGVAAFVIFDPTSLLTVDVAVKWLQANALLASGYSSLALPPPGGTLDPAGQFPPFVAPFVFVAGNQLQGIFPSSVALLNSLCAPLGLGGIAMLSVVSGAVILLAVSKLPEPRFGLGSVMVLGAATPLWFYCILPWEHAPALALSTAAVALVARASALGLIVTGALLAGAAPLLRDEFLVLLPFVVLLTFARHGLRWSAVVACVAMVPTAVLGVVDVLIFNRPFAAHLVHAVRPLAAYTTGGANVPGIDAWSFLRRIQIAIGDWLFGFQPALWPLSLGVLVACIALFAMSRRRAHGVLVAVVAMLVVHLNDLRTYLEAPAFVAGMFRLSPILVFAILPVALPCRSSSARRWSLAVAGFFMVVTLGTLNTDGGPQVGVRLLLPVLPFVAIAAWEGLMSYQHSVVLEERLVWKLGLVLAFGSVLMQTAVAGRAYYDLNSTERLPVEWVRSASERVIVVDTAHTMSLAVHGYGGRSIVMAGDQEAATRLAKLMHQRKVGAFIFVSRERRFEPDFPGFRISSVQATKFTRVAHWTTSPTAILRP